MVVDSFRPVREELSQEHFAPRQQAHAPEGELRPPPDAKQTPPRRKAGALWGQDCWELGGRIIRLLGGPSAALQGAPPLGLQTSPLLLSSLWVRMSLRYIRGGDGTLCLGKEQFRPGLGKQANSTLSPWKQRAITAQVREG